MPPGTGSCRRRRPETAQKQAPPAQPKAGGSFPVRAVPQTRPLLATRLVLAGLSSRPALLSVPPERRRSLDLELDLELDLDPDLDLVPDAPQPSPSLEFAYFRAT